MTQDIFMWMFNEEISLNTNINEPIQKIANIGQNLFVLTQYNRFYKGIIQTSNNSTNKCIDLEIVEHLKPIDIDTCKENLFIVDTEGDVFILNEHLEFLSSVSLVAEHKCARGHSNLGQKVKVIKIAVSEYGRLYISEDGHLWGSGYMPQVDINTDIPKKINFFSGKTVHNISIGADFAVVVVSKQEQPDNLGAEDKTFIINCPKCMSLSQLMSPESNNSISDICPLGVKFQNCSNSEHKMILNQNNNNLDNSREQLLLDNEQEKNIIFRNTEAAKEFLTRQISRMSSVGEEYLIECTEKPTRIIKENMSNVASLVYEGVKSVGDKVATLSRHVSTSSENNNDNTIKRSSSKEDFILSVSQSTSEKDFSEVEIQEEIDRVLNKGTVLLNREVWTWASKFHPLLEDISDKDSIPLLTSDDPETNSFYHFFNKLTGSKAKYKVESPSGIGEIKTELPMIISMLSNIGISKVSLQNHHVCGLTLDGRVFIWGQNNYHQVTLDNNIYQMSPKQLVYNTDERFNDTICGTHFTMISTTNSNVIYFGKGSESYQNLNTHKHNGTEKLNLFQNLIVSQHFSVLNIGPECDEHFNTFLLKEQNMLEEMLCVHQHVIKQLLKNIVESEHILLYENLCKYYTDLLYFLSVGVKTLLEYRNGLISLNDIMIIKYYKEHISIYKNYANIILNVLSINGFLSISKLISIEQNLYKLKSCSAKEKNNEEKEISGLLLSPMNRIKIYLDFLKIHADKDIKFKWKKCNDSTDQKRTEAERTKDFWLGAGKNIDYLLAPDRRLICDSQTDPINLHNSSRFSSHRFVLFSDIFAHINGSSPHLYYLTMLWLELPHHETYHQISLKTPEDILTLVTLDGVFKNKWYHTLQQAINISLNKPDLRQPPLIRSGTYTFTKMGFLKDATYNGRWLNAKMHGAGKLKWPDGRMYIGQFSSNLLSGYGTMEIPNVGIYEGQWKDNKQNGYGIFTYCNKDIYKGYFKDGTPHGHGFLRKGNFMASSASFYIGEWVSGQKVGYGVMDDISTGEKYIGCWADNKKQGNGIIVTSEGVYYEGNFHHDTLLGLGLMVLEDGTHYEGEFKGTGIIGGKGILTLPSGHFVEGNLSGTMAEGIHINGALFKNPETITELPKSFGKLCTPPFHKWRALFRHCQQIMGIVENSTIKEILLETPKIWQNVAVYLTSASTLKRNKGDNIFENSLNNLDVIPPFGRDKINLQSYTEIRNYLWKAFESNFHPLGSLLNNLSEAYIASYSGNTHHILVNHAIIEIIDLTKRVYEIIRHLFPALPSSDVECVIDDNDKDEIISYQSLIYPVLLPKVYIALFTLLTIKNETQEKQYKKALLESNKLSENELMAVLSVDKKFYNLDNGSKTGDNSCELFVEAIETLQQIKSMFLPIEKLTVIRNTVNGMTPVTRHLLGNAYIWNMDDLFPLFLYVVVRARIPDLGAELEFIENFMDPVLENGELGIMFTTLKACYQQILQDKSFCY